MDQGWEFGIELDEEMSWCVCCCSAGLVDLVSILDLLADSWSCEMRKPAFEPVFDRCCDDAAGLSLVQCDEAYFFALWQEV